MVIPVSVFKDTFHLEHTAIEKCELGTQTIRFAGTKQEQSIILLRLRPNLPYLHKCPYCGEKRPIYDHQSGEVRWRSNGINGRPVYLVYSPARISCPEHGIIREYIPWAYGNSRFTLDFCNDVAWMSQYLPKTAIASYFQISWEAVGNCIRVAHANLEPDPSLRLLNLHRIGVDETSYSKGHKYITVVYDLDRCCVVWVAQNHGVEVFSQFCLALTEEQRDQITVVAGDGARWIDTCTHEYFHNAVRCVDPFHVVGWVNEALDEVRKDATQKAKEEYNETEKRFIENLDISTAALEKAQKDLAEAREAGDVERVEALEEYIAVLESYKNQKKVKKSKKCKKLLYLLPEEERKVLSRLKKIAKALKNARYAVGKNPENRTEGQEERLAMIADSAPDLFRAYQLKEELRKILHMRHVDVAGPELDRWIESARNSGLPPLVALADKIERHKRNILNTIQYQANSSQCESCNALIKAIIRIAKGFRNLDNLTAMIFLRCSQLVVPLVNRPQMTSEQIQEVRRIAKEYRQKKLEKKRAAFSEQKPMVQAC